MSDSSNERCVDLSYDVVAEQRNPVAQISSPESAGLLGVLGVSKSASLCVRVL